MLQFTGGNTGAAIFHEYLDLVQFGLTGADPNTKPVAAIAILHRIGDEILQGLR